jgi:hypothetical protein
MAALKAGLISIVHCRGLPATGSYGGRRSSLSFSMGVLTDQLFYTQQRDLTAGNPRSEDFVRALAGHVESQRKIAASIRPAEMLGRFGGRYRHVDIEQRSPEKIGYLAPRAWCKNTVKFLDKP